MTNTRITAVILILFGILAGYFTYSSEVDPNARLGHRPFKLGLDLNGGTHLVYQADTSKTPPADVKGAMASLRNTIEKRINIFGVAEPLVQAEESKVGGETISKLIVELPGVSNVEEAIEMIGKTPKLEFKLLNETPDVGTSTDETATTTDIVTFAETGLTGALLERADIMFDPNTGAPLVSLTFNNEGRELFAKITRENVGRILAVFLDEVPLTTPVINEEIKDGKAQISGGFTPDQAKQLVQDLNFGALPLEVTLVGTQTIGPSLGEGAVNASLQAGLWSFIVISVFLIIWYRLPGLIAVIALAIYTSLNLAVFKLIPVTLTSAGLAAFILSLGMAVDANILIFERMKEEIKKGLDLPHAIKEGFARAWTSIFDSNMSSIITGVILYYFATSSLIKGFALAFVIGVLISMFTAVTVSRTMLKAIGVEKTNRFTKFLFGNGWRFL